MDERDHLIEDLRRRLRRWRLATFALAILLISFIAIAGTVGVFMMVDMLELRAMMHQM